MNYEQAIKNYHYIFGWSSTLPFISLVFWHQFSPLASSFFGTSSGLHSPCFARFTTCVPEVVILPQVPYMSLEWSMLLVHIVQSHHNALLVVSNFLTTVLYTYHSNAGVQLRKVTTQSTYLTPFWERHETFVLHTNDSPQFVIKTLKSPRNLWLGTLPSSQSLPWLVTKIH